MKYSLALLFSGLAALGSAQTFDPANYKGLEWTSAGPARGGRSIACAGVRTRPSEFYFGATGGGLWKTTDAGTTWNCVSDGFFGTSSVGAVAVSDSNPDVVYAGTGEREIRGDISEGDGIYRSLDGGKTWKHMGLEDTRTISRIVVDPKNPDLVYVAALGEVYGPTSARGIYKSTDGGQSWQKILFESDKAGAVELVMDPSNAQTLYAATWEAWRTPYFMNSGGPGSKLLKTTDGGAHWTDLSRSPGLPQGLIGKIGISVSAADPKRVYAIIEAKDGGIYSSSDAGSTWTKVNDDHNNTQRAWYFNHVYADPKKVDRLYCLNVGSSVSNDGGKTWSRWRTTHSDNHDLWICPDDPKRMIESNDGGASVSTDGGSTWSRETYATAEIYHVVADNHIPYRIYGAQQDNSALMVSPSETDRPDRHNWQGTAGGESGYIAVDPSNPNMVYGGNYSGEIEALDQSTGLSRNVNPWPDNPMGHAASDLRHRIQWTFPIVFSPNDPRVLYTASQVLMRTTDGGSSWQTISPDLTRNDRSKQASSGGPITQDNTSIEYYDTIFTVAESPLRKGQIWVGSDDGLVHLTHDGGRSWQDVTPAGMPTWARVSMVEASPHDPGTAYVAANNYQNNDLGVYIYRTHDYGTTWKKITDGIPSGSFARVCRESLHRKGLLFAGTETGAFVSFDDGDHWRPLQFNLPLCPVHDLFLKDNDLIAATHGRAFWIMHNLSRLEELTGSAPMAPLLYRPLDQIKGEFGSRAVLDYYLPATAKSVQLRVISSSGEKLADVKGETSPGFHQQNVSLSHPGFGAFPGMILWSGFPRGIPGPPGTYSVELVVDGRTSSGTFHLLKDPRLTASERDLQAQYAFAVQVNTRANDANQAVVRIRDEKDQIDKAVEAAKNDPAVSAQGASLKDKLTAIEGEIYQYRSHAGEDPLNYPVKLNDKLAGVISNVLDGQCAPTRQARQVFAELSAQLDVQLGLLKRLEGKEVVAYNDALRAHQVAPIVPKNPPLTSAGSRFGGFEQEEREEQEQNEGS